MPDGGPFGFLLGPLLNNQDRIRARLTGELARAVLAEAAVAEGQRIALELKNPLEGLPLGRAVLVFEVDVRRALARVDHQGALPSLLALVQKGRLLALDRQEAVLNLVLLLPINRDRRGRPFALELLQRLIVLGRGGGQEPDSVCHQEHHHGVESEKFHCIPPTKTWYTLRFSVAEFARIPTL